MNKPKEITIDGISNGQRAAWGRTATEAYEVAHESNYDDAEDLLVDLLTDLHHAYPMIDVIKAAILAKEHYCSEAGIPRRSRSMEKE